MEARGVKVVVPRGDFHAADLPILLPEVSGVIAEGDGLTILDVGGDDAGARILGTLAAPIIRQPHAVLQVVNQRRPFTDTVEGCLKIMREIETASRQKVTGLVSNSHLMDETDAATILEGWAFAAQVAEAAGLGVEFGAADRDLLKEIAPDGLGGTAVLPIDRMMLPPWYLRTRRTDKAARVLISNRSPKASEGLDA
jgi:hypothetical protein